MSPVFGQAFTCLLIVVAALPVAAAETKMVALSEAPPAVQKTVAARVGDGHVDDVFQRLDNGETVFEVDFSTKSGNDQDFTVADDGTVLCVGVTLSETPAAVQKTVQAQMRGWEVVGINKDIEETIPSFDVTVRKADRERTLNISDDGTLSSVEIGISEAPAAVQSTIKARIADGHVESIEENLAPAGNSFDVEATAKNGRRQAFSVAADGQMLSEEVALEQVPAPARKAIEEKIGDGKVLRVDKSLAEKKGNVLPYEIQGRKHGRSFNFSVGPRGRFLGMDD